MFLYWVPSLGVAILGPLALLPAWRSREGRAEYRAGWEMWWLTAVTMALWCVVMFGPDATSPRQGSYLTEVLALSGSCLAFWAVRPWVAAVMTGAQMVCNFALFVWLTPVMPPVGAEVATANWFLGAACLVSAAGMGAVLLNFAMGTASRMTGRALHGSSSQ